MNPSRPVIVAHRAGNALDTLEAAEVVGVDMVEADVHWYRGRLEVRHAKTIGPLPILWDRWYLSSPCTPRLGLEQLVAAAAPGTDLLLDLKGPSRRVSHLVLAVLGRTEPKGRISVCARNARLLDPFRGHPEIRVIPTVATRRELWRITSGQEPLAALSVKAALCTPRHVAMLRRRAPLLIAWGVRDPEHLRALWELGVHGFSVADPSAARRALEGPVGADHP